MFWSVIPNMMNKDYMAKSPFAKDIISHYQANRFKWNRHLEYIHSLDNKEFSSMYSQKVVVNWQSVIEKITQLDNIYM